MLNENYTAKILDLEDVIVTNVEKNDFELHIYLGLPRRKHSCPQCGYETDSVHDYREQLVKDLPLGKNTLLHLRKRRYRCKKCHKRFYEQNSFLPWYHRLTNRLAADIICSFSKLQSAKEIAQTHNVSNSTAIRYFDLVSHQCSAMPRVLSIDELKGNAGGERYQSILADPEKRQIVDILPNRFEGNLIQYFRSFPSRKNVEYFITDMNPHFRNVAKVCFPSATIVADKYHVIRQAIWAMERVRKNEQKKLSDRFRKYFKRSRYLLNKPFHKLTPDEQNSLALMLEISSRLADAYRIKNEFLEVMKSNSSAVGREKMVQWLNTLNTYDLPEYSDCEKAVRNWFAGIEIKCFVREYERFLEMIKPGAVVAVEGKTFTETGFDDTDRITISTVSITKLVAHSDYRFMIYCDSLSQWNLYAKQIREYRDDAGVETLVRDRSTGEIRKLAYRLSDKILQANFALLITKSR